MGRITFIFLATIDSEMGKVEKGVTCSVQGCDNPADRSMSGSKVSMAADLIVDTSNKRAYLCRQHYKEWKKSTKEDRENERSSLGLIRKDLWLFT